VAGALPARSRRRGTSALRWGAYSLLDMKENRNALPPNDLALGASTPATVVCFQGGKA
jgi:hypothetical protein